MGKGKPRHRRCEPLPWTQDDEWILEDVAKLIECNIDGIIASSLGGGRFDIDINGFTYAATFEKKEGGYD